MRIIFSLLVLFFSVHFLTAQQDATSTRMHEIGLNATSLFNEFFDFNNDPTALVPYHFTYKSLNASRKGFRLGAGLSLNRSKGQPNNNFSSGEEQHRTFANVSLRLGWERQWQIAKHWSLVHGWDGLTGFNHSKFTNTENDDEVKLTDNRIHVGVGTLIGMQFMFNEKVGLATEANLYLIHTFGSTKEEFEGFSNEENDSDPFNSTSLNFDLPTNLFIFMRF